eukprot:TRINITY_DN21588_c0_g1_i2.p1 TRINITY_DN21588_c0_g1~~TRINITY_DN21588_c0_g1_i2.p1  ORF type:complete len:202 (+),score=24.91 TRINITY_DN21588_c0_g1_i2:203-808(+)
MGGAMAAQDDGSVGEATRSAGEWAAVGAKTAAESTRRASCVASNAAAAAASAASDAAAATAEAVSAGCARGEEFTRLAADHISSGFAPAPSGPRKATAAVTAPEEGDFTSRLSVGFESVRLKARTSINVVSSAAESLSSTLSSAVGMAESSTERRRSSGGGKSRRKSCERSGREINTTRHQSLRSASAPRTVTGVGRHSIA